MCTILQRMCTICMIKIRICYTQKAKRMYTYGSIRDYTNKIEMAIDVQLWGIDSRLEWTRVGIFNIMLEHNMWCNA